MIFVFDLVIKVMCLERLKRFVIFIVICFGCWLCLKYLIRIENVGRVKGLFYFGY